MEGNIHLLKCPACSASTIQPILNAVDYTVSNQSFDIWICQSCTLQFTQDIPDIDHIAPFYQSNNYVSHSDTKEGLINRIYHQVRILTLHTKQALIKKVTHRSAGKLLDIGAGTGAFVHTMQKKGWEIKGLEPDAAARSIALKNYQIHLDLPTVIDDFSANQFDAITLWHVLEHVHDLSGYWKQFKRLMKPNGKLVIAVPNYTCYDARYYQQYWAAYDVPRHLYHFSPDSMDQLANANGFKVEKVYPMWFDSFYVSMLSEQYKSGKSNLINAFLIGLISNVKAFFDHKKCSSIIYVFAPIP